MKIIAIILLLISFHAIGQTNTYVATWSASGQTKFNVQQSTNKTTWVNIVTINANPTDTSFSYTLPTKKNVYYRIKSGNNYSNIVFVYNIPPSIVINPPSPINIKLK